MGIIGGYVGYRLLRLISPQTAASGENGEGDEPDTKLEEFFGDDFYGLIQGKTVVDFGCGNGVQSVEMARRGAGKVIGVDIQEERLQHGRQLAEQRGVAGRCTFVTTAREQADIVISKDAFEHFSDPLAVLNVMATLLKPTGFVLASFGPTWFHPYGGHLFSIFPWSHLLFTEKSQIRWRSDFKTDGATRFGEVAGGLNQLTISRFKWFVSQSPFAFAWLQPVPIKGISVLKLPVLQEIGSSIVRCKLVLR